MAFHFKRPDDFQFKAGQYMNVSLVEPPETDAEGNISIISLARRYQGMTCAFHRPLAAAGAVDERKTA